jgi:DNA-binding response OmpR family regulator
MREQQEHYMSIGIDEIVKKPFSLTDLREVVTRWLNKAQALKSEEDAP